MMCRFSHSGSVTGAVILVALVLLHACGPKSESSDRAELSAYELDRLRLKGEEMANITQAVLATNLMNALQEGGPLHAVSFCNSTAIPISDSMSVVQSARLRRVSDRNRNPGNEASTQQAVFIREMQQLIDRGEYPVSAVKLLGTKAEVWYPIVTNAVCMNCHGAPGAQVLPETLTRLAELYPDDRAVGYTTNQIRGLWIVELPLAE